MVAVAVHTGCGKTATRASYAGGTQKNSRSSKAGVSSVAALSRGSNLRSVQGVYHPVKSGETLWRICKTYGVDIQEVAEINNITDPGAIRAGFKLFIPGAKRVLAIDPNRIFGRESGEKITLQKGKFQWPLRGEISSDFGVRDKKMHNGIDIRAPIGQKVQAAQGGEISYAGALQGYGKVVVIQHGGNFSTVYAHLEHVSVKKGQSVQKADTIGRVGDSGNATGPHLHFEVRLRGQPRNPNFYLP